MPIVPEKRFQPERERLSNRLWPIREDGYPPMLNRKFPANEIRYTITRRGQFGFSQFYYRKVGQLQNQVGDRVEQEVTKRRGR